MAEPLKACTITPAADGYLLTLTAGDATLQATATFEQLDLLAEEIDRLLDAAEEDELAVAGEGRD